MAYAFWFALSAVFYAYIGYPLLLAILRLVLRRPVRRAPIEPTVTLIVPAYNEARVIRQKIENTLDLDYPTNKLQIIVASDGSSDGTAEIAYSCNRDGRIQVIAFPANRGKIATLNAAVPFTRGDILVFSDAAAMLRPDSLRRLVANFADPSVGAVGGRYTVTRANDVSTGTSEDAYWRYETLLKKWESDVHSTIGAHGHLYGIRRELYPYPPANVINDDYIIPTSVLACGYRLVYDPSAVVSEEAREMAGFGRRVRIMAGNIQQLKAIGSLMRPLRPLPLFFFVSHKLTRLIAPLAMLTALVANLCLARSPMYSALLLFQSTLYALALLGVAWSLRPRLLMLPFYFAMINAAAFLGFYYALRGRRGMAWK